MLFDDVKTFIDKEIATVWRWTATDKKIIDFLFVPIATLLGVLIIIILTAVRHQNIDITHVINAEDLGEKLNFLIEQQTRSTSPDLRIVLLPLAIVIGASILIAVVLILLSLSPTAF